MSNTIRSPLVHSPDEYSIVAMPSAASVGQIVAIQARLKSLLGDAIWLTPPNALHCTLMEIICDTEYTGRTRKEYFDEWFMRYNELAREVTAQFQPIGAHFNELHISEAAIIVKATDPKSFNDIRTALLAQTVLPAQTKLPPDIAHMSMARFNETIDLSEIRNKAQTIAVDFHEHVTEFKLMKDLGPDFHPMVVDTYPLKG